MSRSHCCPAPNFLMILIVLVLALASGQAGAAADSEYAVRPLADVQQVGFVAITAEQMAAEDAQRQAEGLPYRFALPVDVALTPNNAGTWENLPDGQALWRLRVASPGVLSLNLGFERARLPEGARLLVYPAGEPGAARRLDSSGHTSQGQIWTPVFLTDELVVELLVSAADRALVDLELGSVGRGYRFFGEPADEKSGTCNVDVICPDGDDWRYEIDSVGLLQRDSSILCTGFMVNNAAYDGRPLFMTAFHCHVDEGSAPSLVVYWNYQSPVCGDQSGGELTQTSSGSTLLAAYVTSDFTLVELDEAPDLEFGVKYAGWNRSTADPDGAVCVHHPRSDEKSISFENDALTTTPYLSPTPAPDTGDHLRVEDWDVGTTEGGSSGSPLFDLQHRVVGQLHGGYAACGNNLADWYGRFSVSWEGGGAVTSRLRDHLDPGNTGAVTTDYYDPLAATFAVNPAGEAVSTRVLGGMLDPPNHTYTVVNVGSEPVNFTVATATDWLSLDTVGGLVVVGAQVEVVVTLNEMAEALPMGRHRGTVEYTNPDGGGGSTSRDVLLTVAENELTVVGAVPNPFSVVPVPIRYALLGNTSVRAQVANLRGFKVRDLGTFAGVVGENNILWDGLDDHGQLVPSGVYVVTIDGLGRSYQVKLAYTH